MRFQLIGPWVKAHSRDPEVVSGKSRIDAAVRAWFWPATVALLAYLGAVQILASRQESHIIDEPTELAAGFSYLKTGDFRMNPEHPPLSKILAALPLLAFQVALPLDSGAWAKGDEFTFGVEFFSNARKWNRLLFAARVMSILITSCLGLAIALWTRAAFGSAAAILALTLYAFDPTITANGHYVKNDVAFSLFSFLACIAWGAFVMRPEARRLLLAGLVLGLAMATKFSAFYLFPVFAILYAIRRWQGQKGLSFWHGIRSLSVVSAVSAAVVFLVYWTLSFNHGTHLGGIDLRMLHDLANRDPAAALARLASRGILRAHPFFEGLLVLLDHNTFGHPSYLLGMHSPNGWWYYFPVAFVVKAPVATLASILLAGLVLAGELRSTRLRAVLFSWFVLAVPLTIYSAVSLMSHLDLGVRYVLPIWPFLFVLTGGALMRMRFRHPTAILILLAMGLAAESVSIFPHYLAFFNILAGGPSRGPAILLDSNIDWGQDGKNLSAWLKSRGVRDICLEFFGTADLGLTGVRTSGVPATAETARRASADCIGAISVNYLYELFTSQGFVEPGKYGWLRARRPDARIGYSIYIYDLRKPTPP
jgi:4-amino-4-deoxy-L-arabinose transferase-like glycosyltransferase